MKRRLPRPAAAIAAGIIVAVVMPLMPAVGLHSQSPPRPVIRIDPQARWVANGAGIAVGMSIRCVGFRYASDVYVEATQSRILDVAHGYGDARRPRCGDRWFERRRVLVTADQHPYLPGRALVQAEFYACARFFGCRTIRAIQQVTIVPLGLPIPIEDQ